MDTWQSAVCMSHVLQMQFCQKSTKIFVRDKTVLSDLSVSPITHLHPEYDAVDESDETMIYFVLGQS